MFRISARSFEKVGDVDENVFDFWVELDEPEGSAFHVRYLRWYFSMSASSSSSMGR